MTQYFVSIVSQPDTVRCMTTLGAYVTQMRERLGLSQVELAERAGMNKGEINAIERGRVALPGADKRRRLAQALGVRHLDIIVAASELTSDEIPQEDAAPEPFPHDATKRQIVQQLATLDTSEAVNVSEYIEFRIGLRARKTSDVRT
jgi:transcriptional regulator with XRE-family HTH domain